MMIRTRVIRPARNLIRRVKHSLRPDHRAALGDILAQADPRLPLDERVAWLNRLLDWVRSDSRLSHDFDKDRGSLQTTRIRFLMQLLDRHPEWKASVSATLRGLLAEVWALDLFCETGLGVQSGFIADAIARVRSRLIPQPPRADDAAELFAQLFPCERDAVWMENLSPQAFAAVLDLCASETTARERLRTHFRRAADEALRVLAAQIAAFGAAPAIRARTTRVKPSQSAYLDLPTRVAAYADCDPGEATRERAWRQCLDGIRRCREGVQQLVASLDETGVSVGLVYALDNAAAALNRAELLLRLFPPGDTAPSLHLTQQFLADLIRHRVEHGTLGGLVRANVYLLARKITEHAGSTGEHYITRTRRDYYDMLVSAAGGGLVTVFTTLFKFIIFRWRLPLFFEGLFASVNYAGSFLVMQAFGFSLATKQTSLTASSLAGKMGRLGSPRGVRDFVAEVATITRSHFAAAIGNVGAVIPLSIGFDLAYRAVIGRSVLTATKAGGVLQSFDPLETLTVPLAALTGMLLWLSSLAAGGIENWVVFNRMPLAISQNGRLRRLVGARRAEKLAQWFTRNVGGWGGNVAVGFLFGFVPIMGEFFGLPIEVRHVTLAASSMAFAWTAIGWSALTWEVVAWPLLGLMTIAAMNMGVSFWLSLLVASRAQNVERGGARRLLRLIMSRFRREPRQFFLPPRASEPSSQKST